MVIYDFLELQEDDLIATKNILTPEYETESHRLSLMTRSQDEIKRLADQLEDNEIRLSMLLFYQPKTTTWVL